MAANVVPIPYMERLPQDIVADRLWEIFMDNKDFAAMMSAVSDMVDIDRDDLKLLSLTERWVYLMPELQDLAAIADAIAMD